MEATEGNRANVVQVRVQGRNEQWMLMAQSQSSAVAFAPNPKGTIDDQGRVEKPTRDAQFHHLLVGTLMVEPPWGSGEGEGGLGDDQVGHRRRVEADFFDAAAELT